MKRLIQAAAAAPASTLWHRALSFSAGSSFHAEQRVVPATRLRPTRRPVIKPWRPMTTSAPTTIVCYHYPCIDGIFAALAAHLHFKQQSHPVRFVPLSVYQPTIDDLDLQGGEDVVYFCDFTPPFIKDVAARVKQVVVLDHHKTAADMLIGPGAQLPSNVHVEFDLQRSGATIALDHFKPSITPALQQVYMHVEDADLWRWRHPDSAACHAGIGALCLEMNCNAVPSVLSTLESLDPAKLITQGRLVLDNQMRWIDETLRSSFVVQLGGLEGRRLGWPQCLAVHIDQNMSKNRSRLGHELATLSLKQGLAGIAVVFYTEANMGMPGYWKVSLRGIGAGTDTTPITEKYGGGGHALASSCMLTTKDFDSWRVLTQA